MPRSFEQKNLAFASFGAGKGAYSDYCRKMECTSSALPTPCPTSCYEKSTDEQWNRYSNGRFEKTPSSTARALRIPETFARGSIGKSVFELAVHDGIFSNALFSAACMPLQTLGNGVGLVGFHRPRLKMPLYNVRRNKVEYFSNSDNFLFSAVMRPDWLNVNELRLLKQVAFPTKRVGGVSTLRAALDPKSPCIAVKAISFHRA